MSFVPPRIAARRLGVPVAWLLSEVKAGRVPSVLLGRFRRVNVEAVERVLMERAAQEQRANSEQESSS